MSLLDTVLKIWGNDNAYGLYDAGEVAAQSTADRIADVGSNVYGADFGLDANWNGGSNNNPWTGGYGYGSGSSGPDPAEIQAHINNLIANANKRGNDLGDLVADSLDSIKSQIKQNEDLYKKTRKDNMLQLDWQPQQQRQQSTLMALRNRMGNAAWGSSLVDLAEGMGRVDDMADVQLINAHKQNENSAWSDYLQADTGLKSDYRDVVNQYKDEVSKLQSQTMSSLDNYDTSAGKLENIEAISRGDTVTTDGDEAYTLNGATGLAPRSFEALEFADTKNPNAPDLYRPDKAETSYNVNEKAGNANRSTVANTAFNDNLNAYRVRNKENKWDTE